MLRISAHKLAATPLVDTVYGCAAVLLRPENLWRSTNEERLSPLSPSAKSRCYCRLPGSTKKAMYLSGSKPPRNCFFEFTRLYFVEVLLPRWLSSRLRLAVYPI